MNFVSRFREAWRLLRGAPATFGGGSWANGAPMFADAYGAHRAPGPSQLAETYKSIIFTCANLNASGVATHPLRLYAGSGGGKQRPRSACGPVSIRRTRFEYLRKLDWVPRSAASADDITEVTNHPFLTTLDTPDPDGNFDLHSLLALIVTYVDVVGTAYLQLIGGDGMPPTELWPLAAQYVYPNNKIGASRIESYQYGTHKLSVEEVARFRLRPGLRNPIGSAVSPAAAAVQYAGLEDAWVSIQNSVLSNGPRPSGMLSPKDPKMPPGPDERSRLERDMNARHARGNAGRWWVTNGAWEFSPINLPPSDLGGLEISNYVLERTCNAFGCPAAFFTRETNMANLQAAEARHKKDAIEPRCHMIARQLTRIIRRYDDRLFFAFDPVCEEDEQRAAKIVDMKLKNGLITINQANEETQWPLVPWGDEPWLPQTLIQPSQKEKQLQQSADLQAQLAKGGGTNSTNGDKQEEDQESDEGDTEDKPKRSLEGENRGPFDGAISRDMPPLSGAPKPPGDKTDPHEDNTYNLPNGGPIRRKLKRFFRRQQKLVLGSIPEIGAPLPNSFPLMTDFTRPMADAMTPIMGMYWDEGGKKTRGKLGLDADAWEVVDPHLHEKIKQATFSFCDATNKTTDHELGHALALLREQFHKGLVESGETIPELRKRVQSIFQNATRSRAEMIARTEASRAIHEASLESAKESGVVAKKKWLLSANSCPICVEIGRQNSGGTALDANFATIGSHPQYSQIRMPPLHPHCRCSVTYELTEEYEKIIAEHGPPDPESFEPGSLGPEKKKAA